jgi:hypothetical protein
MPAESMYLLKKATTPGFIPKVDVHEDEQDQFSRIRCPLCGWHPTASSVWACESYGTPEPYFGGCGTVWNTFATRGKCPGCAHKWQWTSCPNCSEWSLHEDWYAESPSDL